MATIYNLLRSAIIDRWDGQQPVSEVSLGIRTYSAWWMLGADMQIAQHEASQSETGRALINLVCGCSVKRDIPREDRLAVMDADQVPALFLARAAEYLGTDDVVVLHDVSAARYQKVVACAVPGEWWRSLQPTAHLCPPQGRENDNVDETGNSDDDAPSDQHDDTPEPPTPSATVVPFGHAQAEVSGSAVDNGNSDNNGQLSLDFDQMQAPTAEHPTTTLSNTPSLGEGWGGQSPVEGCGGLGLSALFYRYLRFSGGSTTFGQSAWDGKMHSNKVPGTWAWILIFGTIACLLMVLALQQLVFTTYDVMHYSLLPLWLMPLVAISSAYVWNYRRKAGNQLRAAMASLKNHQSCASSAIRSLIDEYSGSQRSDLMEVYYQVFN